MNTDLFISRHGDTWNIIKGDLISLVDMQNPSHKADGLTLEAIDKFNHTFLASIAGFSVCRNFLLTLGGSTVHQEPEEVPTFLSKPEDLLHEEHGAIDRPLPTMPKPKVTRKKKA